MERDPKRAKTIDHRVMEINPSALHAGWTRLLEERSVLEGISFPGGQTLIVGDSILEKKSILEGKSALEVCQLAELPTDSREDAPIRAICDALERAVRFSQCIAENAGTAIRTEAAKRYRDSRAKHPLEAPIDPALFQETVEPWKRLLCVFARTAPEATHTLAGMFPERKYHYWFNHSQWADWNALWEMAEDGPPPGLLQMQSHVQRMEIICLSFCMSLQFAATHQKDTPMDFAIAVLALTPSGWQKPREHSVVLAQIMDVTRLMIIGQSCVLAMDRTELLQKWGLGQIGISLDRLKIKGFAGFEDGTRLQHKDNFFGEWVTIHVNAFMFGKSQSLERAPPMLRISAICEYGQWLESIRIDPITSESDDRLIRWKDAYDDLLKMGSEGGEGERVQQL